MTHRSAVAFALSAAAFVSAFASPHRVAMAAPAVWAIDDGEKIKEDETTSPLAAGTGNPVWRPGEPIRLFALRDETVAFQVVVTADDEALERVTVDLDALVDGGSRIENAPGALDPTKYVGRPIERFREHFLTVPRPSGGKTPRESLEWAAGSGPPPQRWTGRIPDALVPVEVAPAWLPYPMSLAPRTNGIVWFDITVPRTQAAGRYKGTVVVRAGRERRLASLPIELEVVDVVLPYPPVRTMVYYERAHLERRIGNADAAEQHLWRLLHRHRLSPLHGANSLGDLEHHVAALDGTFYAAQNGYEGPGEGIGDGVLALGTYGSFGEPDPTKLATVERVADALSARSLLTTTDTFVYAVDEQCSSPFGAQWKRLIAGSSNANAKKIRVGWTCGDDATKQPVDIAIQTTMDPEKTKRARAIGKEVWVYNGKQPHTASFSTDTAAIGPRVNGWLLGMFDIGRWFYWESTFWYDTNRGGKGPFDPFVTAETFHNGDGDWGMGEGVLLYPGKQVDMFAGHSIGIDGVLASIRLKNWRRGVEDAGYYQLARTIDAPRAEQIARTMLPVAMSAAVAGRPPAWPDAGQPWFEARRGLLAIITHGAAASASPPPGAPGAPTAPANQATGRARGCGSCNTTSRVDGTLPWFVVAMLLLRRRLRSSERRKKPL